MTAATLITNLQDTTLVGLKIGDKTVSANTDTLLALLNMAKDKIAEDTLSWLGGETISQVTGTSEYTLGKIPIQIIDSFDENLILRPRNSSDSMGYYQTSPNTIQFNTVTNGLDVNINYYYSPPDYIISDELVIPATFLPALQFYMAHKAFEIYKGESEIFFSKEYYSKYQTAVNDYKASTDSNDVASVLSNTNKIYLRGIR